MSAKTALHNGLVLCIRDRSATTELHCGLVPSDLSVPAKTALDRALAGPVINNAIKIILGRYIPLFNLAHAFTILFRSIYMSRIPI